MLIAKDHADIPGYELDAIVKEIQAQHITEELKSALEMNQLGDTKIALDRWQKDMAYLGISARAELMFQLERIGMQELHDRYVQYEVDFGEFILIAAASIGCCIMSFLLKDRAINREQRNTTSKRGFNSCKNS